MKMKPLILFAFAATCGLVAMLGVNQLLPQGQSEPQTPETKVLIAVADIPPGTPLGDDNVKFIEYPEDLVPPGAITETAQYEDRAITVRTVSGTIIMKAVLGDPGVVGVSSDIPDGKRLISVPVDATMSNSGLILPGSRVDVMVTYRHPDPKVGTVSATVLEYIEVFSTGNRRDLLDAVSETKDRKEAKNIGMLVTPDEALELKRAEEMGKLHIMMRRLGDATKSGKTDWVAELTGRSTETAPQPVAKPVADSRSALEKFLDGDAEDKADEKLASTDKTKWKIKIFAGGTMRVEEVDLPESEWPEELRTAKDKKPTKETATADQGKDETAAADKVTNETAAVSQESATTAN